MIVGIAGTVGNGRISAVSIIWEKVNLATHRDAWELAKKREGIRPGEALTPQQISKLAAIAEQIRTGAEHEKAS
jgi:hypothetical protein